MIAIPVKLTTQGIKRKVQIPSLAMTFLIARTANVEAVITRRVADASGKHPFSFRVKRVTAGSWQIRSPDYGGMLALIMRQQRAAKGFTVQQMAHDMGLRNWSAYHTYERPNTNPTLAKLTALVGHFKGCELTVCR